MSWSGAAERRRSAAAHEQQSLVVERRVAAGEGVDLREEEVGELGERFAGVAPQETLEPLGTVFLVVRAVNLGDAVGVEHEQVAGREAFEDPYPGTGGSAVEAEDRARGAQPFVPPPLPADQQRRRMAGVEVDQVAVAVDLGEEERDVAADRRGVGQHPGEPIDDGDHLELQGHSHAQPDDHVPGLERRRQAVAGGVGDANGERVVAHPDEVVDVAADDLRGALAHREFEARDRGQGAGKQGRLHLARLFEHVLEPLARAGGVGQRAERRECVGHLGGGDRLPQREGEEQVARRSEQELGDGVVAAGAGDPLVVAAVPSPHQGPTVVQALDDHGMRGRNPVTGGHLARVAVAIEQDEIVPFA